jgi:TRAP-type C4-dicarboxylate transport system permease small subunit
MGTKSRAGWGKTGRRFQEVTIGRGCNGIRAIFRAISVNLHSPHSLNSLFFAFSSREPVSTSLENALTWGRMAMRRALNSLYAVTAALAAASLILIAVLILLQVALRLFGTQIKSADDIAGYALVATTLLGLAHTYRHNAHIRVGLLVERFPLGSAVRGLIEKGVTLFAVILMGWASWVSTRFVYQSYIYHDVSQGLLAIPLWIPQSLMAFGFIVFFIALVDDLVVDMMGGVQSHLAAAGTGDEMPVEK